MSMSARVFCRNCEFSGRVEWMKPGSFAVEILLWLFFLLPGLIYTAWRCSSMRRVCPLCQNTNLVPEDSPLGKKMYADMDAENAKNTKWR